MKSTFAAMAVAGTIAFGAVGCADTYGYRESPAVRAGVSAHYGYDDYYDDDDYGSLSPYGVWVNASYGWVWCPVDVPWGWRPYTVGHWVYTDWGWMWISADPWGSLPYHYGRWGFDDYYGWVWVPGDVWAPAWVSWRYGSGWVGWAPLGPDVVWSINVGFRYGYDEIDRRIGRDAWCFVPTRHFTSTRLHAEVAPAGRNVTLLSVTDRVTRYDRRGARPVVRGPDLEPIRRAVGRPIPTYRVEDRNDERLLGTPRVRGGRVEVFRPERPARAGRDDRVRYEPPERLRSRVPERLLAREEAKQRRMESRWSEERSRLREQQENERRRPPRDLSRTELRRRHEAEIRAQEQRESKLRETQRRRLERFEERSERRRGRGDERGRGDDERGPRDDRRPDRERDRGRGSR